MVDLHTCLDASLTQMYVLIPTHGRGVPSSPRIASLDITYSAITSDSLWVLPWSPKNETVRNANSSAFLPFGSRQWPDTNPVSFLASHRYSNPDPDGRAKATA
ncbi:hypothetical protein FS749_004043 [Ceratobasidium sp. UAMH 11750]|nr:hypothetical protein FS749_004043 [Ceratobasidium sp. UAMH 11750]